MKIHAVYDGSGPKYWRILLPMALMGNEFTTSRYVEEKDVKDIDILFVNRCVGNISLQTICDWRDKYGFKLVLDFDDHWRLDPSHLLFSVYKETFASEVMEAYIKEADIVFVTHERLYNEVIPINSNCHILPNALPFFGQFTYPKTPSDKIRLFWAGSNTHVKDVEILRNPVKRFKDLNIKMVLGGYSENKEYRQMASAFTDGGRLPNSLLKALPVEHYYAMYSECDISLVPLVDNSFNRYKSNLKVLEAANVSAPVIVSNVHPYKSLPVCYVNSQGDWLTHVKRLIKNPSEIKERGEKLREYCNEHFNFDKINAERKQLFEYVTREHNKAREVPICAE